MRGRFRHLLAVVLTCLPLTAGAQACDLAAELQGIYRAMDAAHAAGGRLGVGAGRRLVVAGAAISPEGAVRLLQGTAIAAQAETAVRPLRHLQEAGMTQAGDQVVLAGLERLAVGLAIARAQVLLGGLDCPAPEAPPPADGPSRLWDAAVNEATPGRIAAYYGSGGLALGTMVLLIVLAVSRLDRIGRIRQRHACAIPVTLDDGQAAMGLDLSREGIKVAIPGGAARATGDEITIRIGERRLRASVRWGNAHVFGALFETPLTAAELSALLKLSQIRPRTQARRPGNRSAPEGPGATPPPETKDGTRGGAAKVAG